MFIFRFKLSIIFPMKKCYQLARIIFYLTLITIISYTIIWHYTYKDFNDNMDKVYERMIQEDEARIIPGLGDQGVATVLTGAEKKKMEESVAKLAINVYLSDRIAYNRTLKDIRHPACRSVSYDNELPSASIIVIFHNEPYSILVRTLWSIVTSARRNQTWFQRTAAEDRRTDGITNIDYRNQEPTSPFVYVKEIILVDDSSTVPELKGKLDYYIRTRLPPYLIRIIRLTERVGLIKARMFGARCSTGKVLVFLDAHCEVQPDWLRPLLQALKGRRAVVKPIIDTIDERSFYYSVLDNWFWVGGFEFNGFFYWIDVPEWEKKRRGSEIAATRSPVMAGGLFAMNRNYFFELGEYDDQMRGWGGENLEMSFRIWQCGGTLETVPCSRVGHVFRTFRPYELSSEADTHGINTARMAEVWMDEYAELFYLHRPDLRNSSKIGDVSSRRRLREKLKCKSFAWYLDNVYREKFVPVRDTYGFGRFKNLGSTMCLDALQDSGSSASLGVYPCHQTLKYPQLFFFSLRGEIRDEVDCAEVHSVRRARFQNATRGPTSHSVRMSACDGRHNQKWRRLPTGQIQHLTTRLCLQPVKDKQVCEVELAPCRSRTLDRQRWQIEMTEDNHFTSWDLPFDAKREGRYKKILNTRRTT